MYHLEVGLSYDFSQKKRQVDQAQTKKTLPETNKSHLKNGWNTMLFGSNGLFSGATLLVLGRVSRPFPHQKATSPVMKRCKIESSVAGQPGMQITKQIGSLMIIVHCDTLPATNIAPENKPPQ